MLMKSIMPFHRSTREELLALHDVSFSVEPGETLGVLGRNGAGKSTMMRLLAGVTSPSQGLVRISGRVAPLLSVGVGFHQEMSGRENVYVNGMLLGLSKSEVDERFNEIVDFSELRDFIDTPVKFYSSGMYMRLGFSVAIHVTPQVLLLDEVLAVGDIAFQLKCLDRMREHQRRGTTIVLVSHNMHTIRQVCPRVMLLRNGTLEYDGDADSAINRFHQMLAVDSAGDHGEHSGMPASIISRTVRHNGIETFSATPDDELEVTWTVRFEQSVKSPHVAFRILEADGTLAYSTHTVFGTDWRNFSPGDTTEVRVRFRPSFGGGGTFKLLLDITDTSGVHVIGTEFDGPTVFVGGWIATRGLGDSRADISIAGRTLSDWPDLSFETLRPQGDPPDVAPRSL